MVQKSNMFLIFFSTHCSGRDKHIFMKQSCPLSQCALRASPTQSLRSTQPNGHMIYPQNNAALYASTYSLCVRVSVCVSVCVCSPMTETSYSIRNRASWPLCINMVKASACLSRLRGIPSMLNTRSPALTVPSLEKHRWINKEQKRCFLQAIVHQSQ